MRGEQRDSPTEDNARPFFELKFRLNDAKMVTGNQEKMKISS